MHDDIKRSDSVMEYQSPGGFVFGVQGWTWGEQRPTSITFFIGCGKECCTKMEAGQTCSHHGVAKVSDQHGRPIKGVVRDGKPVYFEKCTHAQVIAALADERIDWTNLTSAGWPQLPYDQLKSLKTIPPTPVDDLRRIMDPTLRKDALRLRRERDDARAKEMQATDE